MRVTLFATRNGAAPFQHTALSRLSRLSTLPHLFHTSCFPQYDSFGLGLEQISRRNVIRILISMWGAAVLVVLAAGATDWAASGSDGPATAAAAAMDTLAVEEGRGWGWIASLTVWRVRFACACARVCFGVAFR